MNLVKKSSLFLVMQKTLAQLLFLFCFWAVAVGSRIYVNGDSFGFDYSIFQPDGVLYALRTYMFLGEDQLTAAKLIESWYFTHGASGNHFDPSSILPSNTPAWGLVAPRILYPLLSVPFVAIFGMNGLLIIPSLSLLVLVFCIYFIGKRFNAQNSAFMLSLAILMSPTVLRWMVSNITDSLFVALFALTCLALESKNREANNYIFIGLLIVLTNLTRFATPIWLAIAVVDFFRGRRKRSLFIASLALIATIPTYLTQPSNSVLPREGDLTLLEKLIALPESFAKIAFIEVAQLAVLDRLLLVILALAFVISVTSLSSDSSLRFILVLMATWAIGALNGSIGVNFRYQLPVLPFACAVILLNSKVLGNWLLGSIGNIKGKEAKQELQP
jgi:hypothetical protein